MKSQERVAVTSRSFSRHSVLRAELLSRYPNATFNDDGASFAGDTLVEFLHGHSKAITALEVIDESIVSRLPQLKLISKVGVGIDMIDQAALKRHGVAFSWTAGTNKRSVAELVIAFAIALLRHVVPSNQDLRAGKWRQTKGRCLSGQTVGIVGCGNVGQEVVHLLRPFDCRILIFDSLDRSDFCVAQNAKSVTLEELLSAADVVSLHTTLNSSSRRLLNSERLSLMKPSAVLINTARGDLVDEDALKILLKEGKLAAAGFDVFATEPPADHELLTLPNFLGTPHIGGSTEEAILAMGRAAIMGLDPNP
jgi:phosphoglycerate dehydrogenase-like enzyme